MRNQTKLHLQQLQLAMQKLDLWQVTPPAQDAFLSQEPFAIDTMAAEFYRMIPGSVSQDAPADLVIFGEKERWTVDHFASKASNSPFKGWELPGKIHYTICAGKIVYQG